MKGPTPVHQSSSVAGSSDISLAGICLPDSDSESDEPLVSGPSRPGLRRSGSPDESRNVRHAKGRPWQSRRNGSLDPQKAQGGPTVPGR